MTATRLPLVSLAIMSGFATAAEAPSQSALRLAGIFSDHMVLQRDMPIPVWGEAAAGEHITVRFAGNTSTGVADQAGHWQVRLPKVPAQATPQRLIVHGTDTITLQDVLVGDVWICSGQSNIEFFISGCDNIAAIKSTTNDQMLRLFTVRPATSFKPEHDLDQAQRGGWLSTTYDNAQFFSAVGFFFGRELRQHLQIPIGLISSCQGGSTAQMWTSVESIEHHVAADPGFAEMLEKRQALIADYPRRQAAYGPLKAHYDRDLKHYWSDVANAPDYLGKMQTWEEARRTAAIAGTPIPPRPQPSEPRPQEPEAPDGGGHGTFMVGNLYNRMIAPLMPFAIKGALWYQGESNDRNAKQYRALLPILINEWRSQWGQGDFPFLVVQLPNIGTPAATPVQDQDRWPWIREAQASAMTLPNTGLAITIDIGDPNDVHGKDKIDVGQRLALIARRQVYGETIVASGPQFRSMMVQDATAWLDFDHVGGGLMIGVPPWSPSGTIPKPARELTGFAIAGADKVWYHAHARIEQGRIAVSSLLVPQPVAVRYGWANNPPCNLYNREQLPAAPFRTDNW